MKSDKELLDEFRWLWIAINVDDEFNDFYLTAISLVAKDLKSRGYVQDSDYPVKWEVKE